MKKFLFLMVFAFIGLTLKAQEGLDGRINGGLPIGDASDFTSFSISFDFSYLWETSETFDAGLTTGLIYVFGKDWDDGPFTIEVDDGQFLPIAAAGRFHASEDVSLGADVGYALGINEGNNGGFYYRPLLEYGISESLNLNASYTGISDDGSSFDIISLGLGFSF